MLGWGNNVQMKCKLVNVNIQGKRCIVLEDVDNIVIDLIYDG